MTRQESLWLYARQQLGVGAALLQVGGCYCLPPTFAAPTYMHFAVWSLSRGSGVNILNNLKDEETIHFPFPFPFTPATF